MDDFWYLVSDLEAYVVRVSAGEHWWGKLVVGGLGDEARKLTRRCSSPGKVAHFTSKVANPYKLLPAKIEMKSSFTSEIVFWKVKSKIPALFWFL